ncbi:MAG: putative nucleotidyltransferase substrate binding domain-containing protein [Gammaproteobacteria bacterium]|nr:putative nucleotidyltransferase substrate binding domain-containing protein [Gammaproteobacteria bacterium]
MEIELLEIRDFLAHHPPFDALPEGELDDLPRHMEVRYLRRGGDFPPTGADGRWLHVVRSGAIELRDGNGRLCEKLGEGSLYSGDCQLADVDGPCPGVAAEDALLYLLPCERLEALRARVPEFDRHFSASVRERLQFALQRQQGGVGGDPSYMMAPVERLLKKQPVTASAGATIREVARLMTEEKVSSVVIMDGGALAGIVTDRDIRARCVAEGLDAALPVTAVMTREPHTIEHQSPVSEALLTMTRLRVNHLPVVERERLVGVLTSSDLAHHQSTSSPYIATQVRKAETVDDLVAASRRLPELMVQLAASSATALHIGEAVSTITDAITGRLLEMAEHDHGPPPVPYAWLAGGSQARREQSSHSDQDNALLLADDYRPGEHAGYFEELARRVTAGLDACGFYYCPGDAMASNPQWRQPVASWRRYFDNWIHRPEPKSLMLASIFFDLRVVHGDRDLFAPLHQHVLEETRKNRIFIAYMVSNALHHRPPLGFFRTFVLVHDGEHDDTLDIKHRGVVPITDIARVYALSEGLAAVNTTERLAAAGQSGALSSEGCDNLTDALEFIASLRIQHQARQIRRAQPTDNFMDPKRLSTLERDHLKDAFKVIQSIQETLANRYQAGRFG